MKALIAFGVLLLGTHVQAASFDCARAGKATEREICASPALSRLDEQMAAAYRRALAVTHRRTRVADDQRSWLRERDGVEPEGAGGAATGGSLRTTYEERLKVLRAEIARGEAARRPFPRADLGRRCTPMGRLGPVSECAVALSGTVAGGELLYQTEACCTDEGPFSGLVVFAADGSALKPVLWAYEFGGWRAPTLVASPAGPLLVAELAEIGAEGEDFVSQVAFRQSGGRWRDIDAMHLWRTLQNHPALKGGTVDVAGYRLDFAAGRGRGRLIPTDGGAGREVRWSFALEGDRLVLTGVDPVC